jgi:hypothetical protein
MADFVDFPTPSTAIRRNNLAINVLTPAVPANPRVRRVYEPDRMVGSVTQFENRGWTVSADSTGPYPSEEQVDRTQSTHWTRLMS